jgi:branched-chain amino acid transport system ATP-binding protein
MTAALQLEGVSVRFGALRAVDGVSLAVPTGQRRAIIGPNGAGKTTLFNAIAGLVEASAGRVALHGADVTRASVVSRARLGLSRTFQITDLFARLSIGETMRLALRGPGSAGISLQRLLGADRLAREDLARVDRALAAARLAVAPEQPVASLSYGEQRQLELAMALVTRPKLLLLDEPAAGLSPAERGIVGAIVRDLPRDITVVLIEHDMDLVLNLVDHVTVLESGRLLVEAPPAAIASDPRVQEVYLGRARAHV